MRAEAGRWLVAAAAALGLATVMLAALGSHAVELTDERAQSLWNTATGMLGFHAIAVLGIAALAATRCSRWFAAAAVSMLLGTALFSGTLLLRAAGVAELEAFPPVGGLLLMAGWLCLGIGAFARR